MRIYFLTFLFICVPCDAGTLIYTCTVKEHLLLKEDGGLIRPPNPYLIGATFSIDRATGKIVGQVFSNVSGSDDVTVLDHGSKKGQFYKVLTIRPGPYDNTQEAELVIVQEPEEGPNKFIGVDTHHVLSGMCR